LPRFRFSGVAPGRVSTDRFDGNRPDCLEPPAAFVDEGKGSLLGLHLKAIRLDELLEFGYLKPKGTAHFYEWNSALVDPPVEGGCRNGKEFGCVLDCDETAFRS